jgi:molybdopterin-guanine dinucleotide biosynthesis protein A
MTLRSMSAAILIGGRSRRMGRDKATLRVAGRPLVEWIRRRLARRFGQVLLIGRHPTLPGLPDLLGPPCALAGIHAALVRARHPRVFVTGCDMPRVNVALIRRLARRRGRVVVPVSPDGPQPLHAIWSRACAGPIARRLRSGRCSAIEALEALGAVRVPVRDARPFANVNTFAELRRLFLVRGTARC